MARRIKTGRIYRSDDAQPDACQARHRMEQSSHDPYRKFYEDFQERDRQRQARAQAERLRNQQIIDDLLNAAWGAHRGARFGERGLSGYSPPPCLAVLGLDLPTDVDQIKRAYREKSKQAHPDAGGSEAAFVALKSAYDEALRLVGAAR